MEIPQRPAQSVYTGYSNTLRGKVYIPMAEILLSRLKTITQRMGCAPQFLPITEWEVQWLADDLAQPIPVMSVELGMAQFAGCPLKIDNDYRDERAPDWLLHAPVEEWLK